MNLTPLTPAIIPTAKITAARLLLTSYIMRYPMASQEGILIRLDLIGGKYKGARKILPENLTGNSA